MQVAVEAGLEGLTGDCGGNLNCATCHAYIDETWRAKIDPPKEVELQMLQYALGVNDDSRLTCQITTRADLDGMTLRISEPY